MCLTKLYFQQGDLGVWVTGVYLVLVLPVLLLYRSLETVVIYGGGVQQEEEASKERSAV